jgi:hypothetical protein
VNRLTFFELTGSTPLNVYVSDVYGNNETKIGEISASIPPDQIFMPPSLFEGAPQLMVTLEDTSGCRIFKILDCVFGCDFSITIIEN